MKAFLRLMVLAAVLVSLFAVGSVSFAQEEFSCATEVACPEIVLPEGFTGDFYLGDQLLAAGQNRPILQLAPGQIQEITVRNIQNPTAEGFNDLFVYQDASVNVNLRGGQTRSFNVRPRQAFIRGTLNLTCDPRNINEGEDVSCQVIIDGADRGVFPAGEVSSFVLDPGDHMVVVNLVGGSANLWATTTQEQTTSITAGRTATLRNRFDKLGHLVVNLDEEGAVGDFYINDVLIASQVPSVDMFVTPNQRQNIVVRNINPPQAGFRWLESTGVITLGAGRERTLTIRLVDEPLVSAAQTAALNNMQRTLDNTKTTWQQVADLWRNPAGLDCSVTLRAPRLPRVSQRLLDANPTYLDAFNVLTNAVNETANAVALYNTQCGLETADPNNQNLAITSINNAEAAFNDVQNRITSLRNPAQ